MSDLPPTLFALARQIVSANGPRQPLSSLPSRLMKIYKRGMDSRSAKYHLGQIVRHKRHAFRGVIFDVDPAFSNTEEWYCSIPAESRPRKDQPFYHLLAENDESFYVAYVSEQNLVLDDTGVPVEHPDLAEIFGDFRDGHYALQIALN